MVDYGPVMPRYDERARAAITKLRTEIQTAHADHRDKHAAIYQCVTERGTAHGDCAVCAQTKRDIFELSRVINDLRKLLDAVCLANESVCALAQVTRANQTARNYAETETLNGREISPATRQIIDYTFTRAFRMRKVSARLQRYVLIAERTPMVPEFGS